MNEKPKKKRPRLPMGAVEFRLRFVRNAENQLQFDVKNSKIRPDMSQQVLLEAIEALAKWAKNTHSRMKLDRSAAPYITEAVENAGARLTQVAVNAVFERLLGNRTAR